MILNPDVQDKVIEEIDKTIPVGSEINAENLAENLADLTYMDQTVCESMR